jgi:hypothetical protein
MIMLVVRAAQLEALRAAQFARFENTVLEHVREFFGERCAELGPEGVRNLIKHGMTRARCYGIEREKDVCKYIDISFVFGRDFDVEQPWAGLILLSSSPGPERIQALFEVAVRGADSVP